MKKFVCGLIITGLSLFAADGRTLSSKCAACHGANFEKAALGKSAIVQGQLASDIYAKLLAYKEGRRNIVGMGALMKGQMASMSNKDMWAVAEYVASIAEEAPAAEAAPANDWPLACEKSDIAWVDETERYFKVASSDAYLGIGADSQTIQIDRKNKIIKVWTIWLSSENERQKQVNRYGNQYNNFGYIKQLSTIDYQNMRSKLITLTEYECNGNVIQSFQGDNTWSQTVPDSVMESMTKRIIQKYNLK